MFGQSIIKLIQGKLHLVLSFYNNFLIISPSSVPQRLELHVELHQFTFRKQIKIQKFREFHAYKQRIKMIITTSSTLIYFVPHFDLTYGNSKLAFQHKVLSMNNSDLI